MLRVLGLCLKSCILCTILVHYSWIIHTFGCISCVLGILCFHRHFSCGIKLHLIHWSTSCCLKPKQIYFILEKYFILFYNFSLWTDCKEGEIIRGVQRWSALGRIPSWGTRSRPRSKIWCRVVNTSNLTLPSTAKKTHETQVQNHQPLQLLGLCLCL